MFKMSLKIAWRNILKNKVTNLIKLMGLIVGLTAVLLLSLYLNYELSFDKHNENSKKLFRIHMVNADNKVVSEIPEGFSKLLKEEFSEIDQEISLSISESSALVEDASYPITVASTQSSFFEMFGLEILKRDKNNLLTEPNTGVISQSYAAKLFPKGDVIGKHLLLKWYDVPIKIVGVLEDIPNNTHFSADLILKGKNEEVVDFKSYRSRKQYILLHRESDIVKVRERFGTLISKYNFPKDLNIQFFPVSDIHLKSHTASEFKENNDVKYIYIFSTATGLILLIAVINFVNLTVASCLKRSKEIGLKKVLGASLIQLRIQFLLESYLYFLIAGFCAVMLSYDFYPILSLYFNIDMQFFDLINSEVIVAAVLVFLTTGFVAGFYPALILSNLQPVKTLKANPTLNVGGIHLKKVLLILQFGISAFLIVCSLVVNKQVDFIRSKDLGMDEDHVIHFAAPSSSGKKESFKTELLQFKEIESVSFSNFNIGRRFGGMSSWQDEKDTTKTHRADFIVGDTEFVKTLGIKMSAGSFFSAENPAHLIKMPDLTEQMSLEEYTQLQSKIPIVLNEAAVKDFGIIDPVGKHLNFPALKGQVIGVVKDFNAMSLHAPVSPVVMRYSESGGSYVYLKVKTKELSKIKPLLAETWKKYSVDPVPEFNLVADTLDKLYVAESRLANLVLLFSLISIFLCCVGLYGMIYYELQLKTKEIAVRKILGSSNINLVFLLNRGYFFKILLANIVVWPVAFILLQRWLTDFFYRIDVSPIPFILTLSVCLMIAFTTITLKALGIVRKSPADSLKYE